MSEFISFAIGDNVSFTAWGEIEETRGIISACSMDTGSLQYGIDGLNWFNVEDNNIKLVCRATEDSVSAIYSLVYSDDSDEGDDSDDLDTPEPLNFTDE